MNFDQYEEANFYHTLMDFAQLVNVYDDMVFAELRFAYPEIFDKMVAFMCNQQIAEFKENKE